MLLLRHLSAPNIHPANENTPSLPVHERLRRIEIEAIVQPLCVAVVEYAALIAKLAS
ncbi:hypothetical protein D3C86_2207490 [compost metagenome]